MRPGELVLEVEGVDLLGLDNEPGGHRIQRIPPTERKGRVHTSTVTVSVLEKQIKNLVISDNDLRIEWYSGTGAGGQHRNKKQNSCRLTHIPSGMVITAQGRSRDDNLRTAKAEIFKRLDEQTGLVMASDIGSIRREQVGSGMRGDKVRTYRFQDDQVVDHQTGKRASCEKVLRGYFNLLW